MSNGRSSELPTWLTASNGLTERMFSLSERPEPVPVDLRRSWRLAVVVLILRASRSNRASHDKLVLLNSAVRGGGTQDVLGRVFAGELSPFFLQLRVDPALARALDFGVGVGLLKRLSGARIELTEEGVRLADAINESEDLLWEMKSFLYDVGSLATEYRVRDVLNWR